MHGRKYYVHIVEKGQTVYSISRAYKVESYDAVTHVDIHFLHPGDTVWLPVRGQFSTNTENLEAQKQEALKKQREEGDRRKAEKDNPGSVLSPYENTRSDQSTQSTQNDQNNQSAQKVQNTSKPQKTPEVKKVGKVLRMAVMMPLHLDQIDDISTTKFDIEQRGKKTYRQFEFIEFYEGIALALDKLAAQGIHVELNVVDVSDNNAAKVEEAFASHNVAQSDVLIALLLRECFDKAAELAQQAGIYIVNPMATRSELCAENPYMVKIQPSTSDMVARMLANMKSERPDGHLYIVHSGAKAEKPMLEELKRQLTERGDIKYTLFNWSQNAKLANVLKGTPNCSVLSIYDQGKDLNRVFAGNLLNRLAAFKTKTPTLYTLNDWTREYNDIDYAQLQFLNYHTYYTSWDMTNEVHVDFLHAFRERYATEPTSSLAATGYDLTLYIVEGLHKKGADFWNTPTIGGADLTQPIRLLRRQAGLENVRATLFRMDGLRFVPANTKD
jgi:hypothetical protein